LHWIGKIFGGLLSVLGCLLLVILGLHLANDLFQFLPVSKQPIQPGDKFEIYRDLLIILLTSLGIIGYLVYKQIRSNLLEDLIHSAEKNENAIYARLFNQLSTIHWSEYQEYQKMDTLDEMSSIRYNKLCDLAATEADQALSFCEKLDKKSQEGVVNALRINLAYHLAVLGDRDYKEKALELVKAENREKAIEYAGNQGYEIRESVIWVILKFSDDEKEKKEAEKQIRDLMRWTHISMEWKKKMVDKYKRTFRITLDAYGQLAKAKME